MTRTETQAPAREFRWIAQQMRPYGALYVGSLICTGLGGLLALADPLIVKWLIDTVLPRKNPDLLLVAAGSFLCVFFARLFANNAAAVLNFRATHKVLLHVRALILRHLQMLSAEFYDRNPVGSITFRIDQDVDKLREVGGDFVLTFTRTLVFSVLIVGTMLVMNARLALVVVPLLPLFLVVRRKYDANLKRWAGIIQERSSQSSSFLQETLSAVIQVQVLGRETTQLRRFFRLGRRALQAQIGRRNSEAFYGAFSSLIIALGLGLVLSVGGYAVIRGALSVGTLVAFYSYLSRLFEPLSGAVDIHTRVPQLRVSIGRILDLLNTRPAVSDRPDAVAAGNITDETVTFADVNFGYGDRKVLEGFSCEILPRTKVVLVGPSGSGKSTVARLLLRLYDVDAGQVRIGQRDIRTLQVKSLRAAISLVQQEPLLFDGTVRENVLLGNPQAGKKDVDNVIRLSGLESMIARLPHGEHEYIGPRGAMLSGGEKQRLALAQALLRRSQILILDESTSALDAPTEAKILRMLDAHLREHTVLFISHRPSVMQWADWILLIDNHRIAASGKHSVLYANNALYRKIFSEEIEKENRLTGAVSDVLEQAAI